MELVVSISIGGEVRGTKTVSTPCVIGRSKEATLTVAHPAMSRKHCEIYEEGGTLFLRDNSSLNGTQFHGEFVEAPVKIRPGEEFAVGELVFQIMQPTPTVKAVPALADKPTVAMPVPQESPLQDNSDVDATILEKPVKPDESAKSKEPVKSKEPKNFRPEDVRINIK